VTDRAAVEDAVFRVERTLGPAALIRLTENLAAEVGEFGVRVFAKTGRLV
jgi:hypothetical protein